MWNPIEKPYRVTVTRRTSAPGHYGWRSDTQTFASLDDARSHAAQIRHAIAVHIHRAVNPETWRQNGRWQIVK